MRHILVHLHKQLNQFAHFVIDIEKVIISYLHKVKASYANSQKLRKLKYLNDQLTIRAETNIVEVLANQNALLYEPNPAFRFRLSLDMLHTDEEVLPIIKKAIKKAKTTAKPKRSMAGSIPKELLGEQIVEESYIDLEKLKNSFVAGSSNLFDFIQNYSFDKEVSFEERVTIYCQVASEYHTLLDISEVFRQTGDVEFAVITPKTNAS